VEPTDLDAPDNLPTPKGLNVAWRTVAAEWAFDLSLKRGFFLLLKWPDDPMIQSPNDPMAR
jgi:hypothetical protein